MILTKEQILLEKDRGRIHISPFNPDLVSENSVDVRLSNEVYFNSFDKLKSTSSCQFISPNINMSNFAKLENLYTKKGLINSDTSIMFRDELERSEYEDDQEFILFEPQSHYLCTTVEEIGTINKKLNMLVGAATIHDTIQNEFATYSIVPEMRAKSSWGRLGFTVALCAGLGEVGYCSRWALEVFNFNRFPVFVAVNSLVAQVVFNYATPTEVSYGGSGRYQTGKNSPGSFFIPKPIKVVK